MQPSKKLTRHSADSFKPQNHRTFESKSFMYYSNFLSLETARFLEVKKCPKISSTKICLSIFHVRPLKMLSKGGGTRGAQGARATPFF